MNNYSINLIDVTKIEEVSRFRTDLYEIFGMMKYRQDKEKLSGYIEEHRDYFGHLDRGTYQAIGAMFHSKRLLTGIAMEDDAKEDMDMGNAIDDIYQDGVEQGREEINILIQRLIRDNRMDDLLRVTQDKEFKQQLFDEFGIL